MKKSPSARAQSLYSLAGLLVQKRQPLVTSIQTQTGLTLEEANQEVDLSISRLYEWAARCDKDMCGVPVSLHFHVILSHFTDALPNKFTFSFSN